MTRRAFFHLLIVVGLFRTPNLQAQGGKLYEPRNVYATGTRDRFGHLHPDLTYPDQIQYMTAGNFMRRVPIAIWIPHNARGPLPVVIWMHGGGPRTGDNPEGSMTEWAITTARAGYVSIAVTHVGNSAIDGFRLCQSIGYTHAPNPAAVANALHNLVNSMLVSGAGNVDVSQIISQFPELFEDLINGAGPAEGAASEIVMDRLVEVIDGCRAINNAGIWDRLYDVRTVMQALAGGAIPALRGLVDVERIAVAGHSNGSNSALQAAGLVRTLPNAVPVTVPDGLRPIAAVGLSPMGPNEFGLFDTASLDDRADPKSHSWQGLDLPVFTATGDGDEGCKPHRFECGGGDTGSTRRIPFLRMPQGNKYLMYVGDRTAPVLSSLHTLFALGDKCPAGARQACETTKTWLQSAVLAFLDAHVRGLNDAGAWLRSDQIERVSGGIVQMFRR